MSKKKHFENMFLSRYRLFWIIDQGNPKKEKFGDFELLGFRHLKRFSLGVQKTAEDLVGLGRYSNWGR